MHFFSIFSGAGKSLISDDDDDEDGGDDDNDDDDHKDGDNDDGDDEDDDDNDDDDDDDDSLETLKYWVGVQRGHSYLIGRRCLFSLGWPPF